MQRRKKILHVIGVMDRGGAETMLMHLFRNLKEDYQFIFLINKKKNSCPTGAYDNEILELGGELHYIDSMWDIGLKNYIFQFKNIIKEIGDIDIVHSHQNSRGGIIAKAAAESGINRIIVHSHAILKFSGPLKYRIMNYSELYFQKYLINKYATDFWACSNEAMNSLFFKRRINSKSSHIIHNAIDINKYFMLDLNKLNDVKNDLKIPKNTLVLGTIGRITEIKKYKFIIDILNELKKQKIKFYFVLIGSPQNENYTKEVFEKIKKYNLEKDILYIKSRSDLEYIYPQLDILIGASVREGLGMVSIEAQASGTKCILSNGFPKTVDLKLDLVDFMDDFDLNKWVEKIKEVANMEVVKSESDITKSLRVNGYDIMEESLKVRRLYEGSEILANK